MRYTLLKEWYTKNFLGIVYAVSSGIVLLNILTLYAIFTVQRTSNDECLWQPVKQKNNSAPFIFKSVKVNGVTWQAGIRDGDFLLQINDKAIKTSAEAQDIINKIEEGGTVIYKVQRGKEIFKTTVTLKKLVDIGSLSFSLFAAIWFIVGFLVLIAKPDGYLQRLFFLVGVLFSLMRSFPVVMQALPVYGYHPLFIAYFMLIVWCTAIFPLYYYRFFALFPGESQRPLHKYIEITVKILAVLATGTSYYVYLFPRGIFFLNVENPQLHSLAFVNYIRPAVILTNVAFFVGFIILLTKYIRMKDKQGRKKITLILISYGVGQIGLVFFGTVAPTMGYIVFNSPEYFTPILLVVFLPIAFAVSIFRYNLMDVSTVVKNTILYGTATISLAILYFLIVLGMGNAIGSMVPQIYSNIVSLFFFVLFAIVFQTKKDNFQELLTKQFYPEQFAYRKVLIGFHQNLSQIVGRENILEALMNLIINVIKVQKAGLLLVQPGNNIYKFERLQNMKLEERELLIHPEKIVKAVAARKKGKAEAVFGQDNMHELFGANTHHLLEQGVFTVVPLICGKHVPGFLLLGLKRSGSQFGGKDLSLLASVAGQISISLENARLYEAEVQKIELEKELDVARRIQQNLLPKQLPVNPRVDIYGKMIPAQHIGGDYFDIIELDSDRFFVAVGDVSGKGLPASLYMARVQTLVQAECRIQDNPRDVLIAVNKKLIGSMEKKTFITMSLALFDLTKNSMSFCRAGHIPLLIKSHGIVREIKTPGIGLGLDKGAIFERSLQQDEFALEKGQVYVFMSDGINEAMDLDKECIGTEEIVKVISESNGSASEIMAEATWERIAVFKKSAEPNDDMTLVILRILS